MARISRAPARRLSITAVVAAGLLAPLGVGAGGAHADAPSPAPVNGPLVYRYDSPTTLYGQSADNSDGFTLDTRGACDTGAVTDFSYSPDGTKAVVSCNGEKLRITGADLKRAVFTLPDNRPAGTQDVDPIWSPDGKIIYFTRQSTDKDGRTVCESWSIKADGTGAAPVSGIPAGAQITDVAPNGAFLLTTFANTGHGPAIAILDPGATKPRAFPIGGYMSRARFSPDGTKFAATLDDMMEGPKGDVLIYDSANNSDTGKIVAQATQTSGSTFESPIWSPDSKMVAFSWYSTTKDAHPTWTTSLEYAPADGSAAPKTLGGPYPSQPEVHVFAWHNGPIPTTPRPAVTRLAGADRIGTSVAVADAAYHPNRAGTSKAEVAVISRSDNFADALAGNALAAQKHGPLLLTGSDKLDPAVAHELSTVLGKGATVYVLGGPEALSPQVEADLRALGLTPKRLAGADRFETATKIAAEVSPHPHTVLVATGINYPDALAAGAAAATDPNGGVVLLSDDKTIPASTKAYLAGVDPTKTAVYGVGGQGVAALKTQARFAGHFTELAGGDRYATDLAVANDSTLFPARFPEPSTVGIATGEKWPDALSGGAFVGALHGPLLLTDNGVASPGSPVDGVDKWLSGHALPLSQIAVFGGPLVIHEALLPGFGDAAFGKGNFDVR